MCVCVCVCVCVRVCVCVCVCVCVTVVVVVDDYNSCLWSVISNWLYWVQLVVICTVVYCCYTATNCLWHTKHVSLLFSQYFFLS